MRLRVVGLACGFGLLAALTLGGCTASSRPSTPAGPPSTAASPSAPAVTGTPPIATSPPTPDRTPPTSGPGTSAPPPPSTTRPTTTPPSTISPSTTSSRTSSPVPASSSCSRLTIRVLLGSGAPGYEFAALQFVNDGSTACTLVGVPTVSLLTNGHRVGDYSEPSSTRARFSQFRLAPGAVAESKLKDFSSCNAPLSTAIQVVAPGSTVHTTRPGQLRACRLVVHPLGPPE